MKKIILLLLILLLVLPLMACGSSGLTLEQYNSLYTGMSHRDAMAIIRPHATRSAELGEGDFHTVTYTVEGSGSRGANAIITFQGSPLTLVSRAQAGLR